MKYKFKKGDTVYMIISGQLTKGIIEKRYKDKDMGNIYYVDFRSSNAGLGIDADFIHIQENAIYYRYQELFKYLVDDLKDRLEYKGLKL